MSTEAAAKVRDEAERRHSWLSYETAALRVNRGFTRCIWKRDYSGESSMITRLRLSRVLLMALSLLAFAPAHADWVLDLGPSFDVRVVGRSDFSERRTTYTMTIENFTSTTYDCTGSIGYYRIDTGATEFGTSSQGAAPPGGPWIIVASSVAFDAKLATGYDYLKVSCTPRTEAGTGGGAGGTGGGTGGTQYPRFGAGNLAYTLDPNTRNANLRVARVENLSPTRTTGTLTLQLWALNAPYTGSATSGVRMASARLPAQCGDSGGTLGPGVACTDINIDTALTLPNPGTYTATYVLFEHDSLNCTAPNNDCIVDYFNFQTNGLTINANNTVSTPQGLSLNGPVTYSLNFANNSGSFTAAKLINNSTDRTTNLLQLELWLTAQPYTGSAFIGYRLLATNLPGTCPAQLAPAQSCNNMSYSSSLLANAPDGTYYVTLFVTQQTATCSASGGFCVSTSVDLGQVTKNTAPPPPPPPTPTPPTTPSDSGGGGGALGEGMLLALGLLIGLRALPRGRARALIVSGMGLLLAWSIGTGTAWQIPFPALQRRTSVSEAAATTAPASGAVMTPRRPAHLHTDGSERSSSRYDSDTDDEDADEGGHLDLLLILS